MRIEGILFSYEIMPRDRGDIAFEEVNKFMDMLSKKIPELKNSEIILMPEGVKGLILVDLRKVVEGISPEEIDRIRKQIIEEIKGAFDRGELLSIPKVRIIHKIVKTNTETIAEESKYFAGLITDKWKIEIHTRKIIDRMQTIRKVAEHINQPVDLKNPHYILNIEVIGPEITVIYLVDIENIGDTIIKL